jgi:hypothetical protein
MPAATRGTPLSDLNESSSIGTHMLTVQLPSHVLPQALLFSQLSPIILGYPKDI